MRRPKIRRGQIWWADLPAPRRSEPGLRRPVLVVQADSFSRSRIQTVIVAAITSHPGLAGAPGSVLLPARSLPVSKALPANRRRSEVAHAPARLKPAMTSGRAMPRDDTPFQCPACRRSSRSHQSLKRRSLGRQGERQLHNPPHPGAVLRTLCLEPLNVTVTEAAKSLGVSRNTLSSKRACRHQPGDGGPSLHRIRHERGKPAQSAASV